MFREVESGAQFSWWQKQSSRKHGCIGSVGGRVERTGERVAATEVREVLSDWRRPGAKWRRMKRTWMSAGAWTAAELRDQGHAQPEGIPRDP